MSLPDLPVATERPEEGNSFPSEGPAPRGPILRRDSRTVVPRKAFRPGEFGLAARRPVSPDDVFQRYADNAGLGETPAGSNCNWVTRDFYRYSGYDPALVPGCYSWCAAGLSLFLNAAWGDVSTWPAADLGVTPTYPCGFAYVPAIRWAFGAQGLFLREEPQAGDIIIYDWDGDDEGDHTGVWVADYGDGTCLAWEANTSHDTIEQMRRPYSLVSGFCRVRYGALPRTTPAADPWADLFVPILAT